jgi:phosphoglycolate phosphatase
MHGVIFDLDGTLVHSLPGIAAGVNHALSVHGHPEHSEATIRSFIGNGLWRTCRRALPAEVPDDEVAHFRQLQIDYYTENWRKGTTLYDGIFELLTKLQSEKIPVAICTNKPHDLAVETMAILFPEFSFVAIIGERATHPSKPDPTGALEIAGLLDLPPEETYFVGDSTVDFQTARNAGMRPLLVTWGYHNRPALEETGAPLMASVAELGQALKEGP